MDQAIKFIGEHKIQKVTKRKPFIEPPIKSLVDINEMRTQNINLTFMCKCQVLAPV